MKTKTNKQKSCMMAVVFAIFLCGGYAAAQSDPEEFGIIEMNSALISLNELMKALENEIMYEVPVEVEEDVNLVIDRLEEFFTHLQEEVIYDAPDENDSLIFWDDIDYPMENLTDIEKNQTNRGL